MTFAEASAMIQMQGVGVITKSLQWKDYVILALTYVGRVLAFSTYYHCLSTHLLQ